MEINNKQIKTGKILKPGQAGTKKWMEIYGDKLICVRYRYDEESKKKIKTVEIVVDESEWEKKTEIIPMNKILPLQISIDEYEMRRMVKSAGGKWNPKKKVWMLCYSQIIALGIEDKIEKEQEGGKK